MRVNRFGEVPGFSEFDVILTIESEEEARALYAIFNYSPNMDMLPDGVGELMRCCIGERFSKLLPDSVIARGTTYKTFYAVKVKSEKL